jgi:hypothetical protein
MLMVVLLLIFLSSCMIIHFDECSCKS